jgi:hypothetical protein
MVTRELLLKHLGYEVVSVLGDQAARQMLSGDGARYDLFIVGHGGPHLSRVDMVLWLKKNFPGVKVLSLNPPHVCVSSADYNVLLNGPEEWLRVVASAIG